MAGVGRSGGGEVVGGRVRECGRERDTVGVVVRGGGRGGRVGSDVGRVGHGGVGGRGPRTEQVVAGVLGVAGVVAAVHHLPHLLLLLLVHVVGQLSLLVAGGGHPLVHVGAGHLWRVRGVEAGLKLWK